MKAVPAKVTKALNVGSVIPTCDNSGAKTIQVISVKGFRGQKRKLAAGGCGDLITAAVLTGKTDMRNKVVQAVIVRQKKEYRRPDGMRVCFEDNAAVVMKDEKGNPKGTMVKGPIAKEAALRFPAVAKIANIII
jgi:large subunit ribosomal protein L14